MGKRPAINNDSGKIVGRQIAINEAGFVVRKLDVIAVLENVGMM